MYFYSLISRSSWSKRLQGDTVNVSDLGLQKIATPPTLSALALLHVLEWEFLSDCTISCSLPTFTFIYIDVIK